MGGGRDDPGRGARGGEEGEDLPFSDGSTPDGAGLVVSGWLPPLELFLNKTRSIPWTSF